MIAKRRERFKSEEDTESEQKKRERQARFNPDASKQAERKERFEKWLPSGGSSAPGMKKSANADVAAALGTSLDNSVPKRGGGGPKGKAASTAPKIEYSEEFKAKAEVRSWRKCVSARLRSVGKLRPQLESGAFCILQLEMQSTFVSVLRDYLHIIISMFCSAYVEHMVFCCH